MGSLRSQRVVITGASSGIGRATALEMARRGASLVLAARGADRLEEVAALCRSAGAECEVVVADISVQSDCRRLIEQAGRVDVLVNNAGFGVFESIELARPDDLEAMMQTNYFGTVWCTQAVLPQMLTRGAGSIVNIASIAGIMGYARMGGYCATKFAMIGFSEALHAEVTGRGVRVSMICPGTTETRFFEKAERGKMPGASRLILAVPPERVARAIANVAENGRYRTIVPTTAALFMRFKEIFPSMAHLLMRRVSSMMEPRG